MRRHRVEWLHGVAALFALAMAGGCSPHSYAGIDLRPGHAPAEVQALAARAQAGDKQAQLELGVRYEEGRGVPVDSDRAEKLYLDAATDPGRARRIVYVATPGRRGTAVARSFQDVAVTGPEALLRWHRLFTRRSRSSVGSASSAPSAAKGLQNAVEWDPAEATRHLDALYAVQPIFNGLSDLGENWRARIVREPGARLFTPRGLDDTLGAISPTALAPGGSRMLCAKSDVGTGLLSSSARLAGICGLRDCAFLDAEKWLALTSRSAKPRATELGAEDAAFLFRVAALCDDRPLANALSHLLRHSMSERSAALRACGGTACAGEARIAYERSRIARDMHLLFAVAESDLLPADLALDAARNWRASRLPAPVPDGTTDGVIAALCVRAAVPEADCRRRYPHGSFLEQHYLDFASRSLLLEGKDRSFCTHLASFSATFRAEIEFRFATTAPKNAPLIFAPRCSNKRVG